MPLAIRIALASALFAASLAVIARSDGTRPGAIRSVRNSISSVRSATPSTGSARPSTTAER